VYELGGKEIETIMNDELQAGDYSLLLNSSHFPKGVYLVKMISDDGIENQELVAQ